MEKIVQIEYEEVRSIIQDESERLAKQIAQYPDKVILKVDNDGNRTLEFQKHPYAAALIKMYQERWESMVDDFNKKWKNI